MSYSSKMSAEFVHYLESVVNLDALDRMIKDLDDELKDSQKVMNEVKTMIDSLPKRCEEPAPIGDNVVKHEGISSILARSPPNLLLPDMVQHTDTVDIDSIIATMKSYTEDMRKKFAVPDVEVPVPGRSTRVEGKFEDLNLEQYANSLDVLCKRLSNLKLNKKVETDRNMELETKLAILFDDVNMFTQVRAFSYLQ